MSFEVYRESRDLFSQAEKSRFIEYFASSISHESSGFESATRFDCVHLPILFLVLACVWVRWWRSYRICREDRICFHVRR